MHWASFDPFTIDDSFWHDKMGMPVANTGFLRSLLIYGSFSSYRFFCSDTGRTERFLENLQELVPSALSRVEILPQALALLSLEKRPWHVMHNGDFTHYMPHLIEWRNGLSHRQRFPVTGVTHSLDIVPLYTKLIHLLLAEPKPYDAIVCTSQCALRMLENSFAELKERFRIRFGAHLPRSPNLVKIPLAIEDDVFDDLATQECRKRLNISRNLFVILSLARFSPRRKMDLSPLLECLAWLNGKVIGKKSFSNWQLILAGAGKRSDIKLVQEMVTRLNLSDHVRIEPNVSREKKMLLYGAADVFCSLVDNYQETFGLTLLEAMSHGLPVIASDFDGYRELVSHGLTGFLIPTFSSLSHEPWESMAGLLDHSILRFYRAQKLMFDMDDLADAILKLAFDPSLREEMGTRAKVKARAYRWSVVLRSYEDLWRDLRKTCEKDSYDDATYHKSTRLLVPSMERSFSHYPTASLQPDTVVETSSYGTAVFDRLGRLTIYQEASLFIHPQFLKSILRFLSKRSRRLDELLEALANHFQLPFEVALLHVDWLMKHGLIRTKKILKSNQPGAEIVSEEA